jgi:hypothetical protein
MYYILIHNKHFRNCVQHKYSKLYETKNNWFSLKQYELGNYKETKIKPVLHKKVILATTDYFVHNPAFIETFT